MHIHFCAEMSSTVYVRLSNRSKRRNTRLKTYKQALCWPLKSFISDFSQNGSRTCRINVQLNAEKSSTWRSNVRFHTLKLHVGRFSKPTCTHPKFIQHLLNLLPGGFWKKSYIEFQFVESYIKAQYENFIDIHMHTSKNCWSRLKSIYRWILRKGLYLASMYNSIHWTLKMYWPRIKSISMCNFRHKWIMYVPLNLYQDIFDGLSEHISKYTY